MYKIHSSCRACGYATPIPSGIKSHGPSEKLRPVFDLGITPLANDFCNESEERAGYVPLKVMLCPRCFLAQLSVTVDPAVLYSHYLYVTSPSDTMRNHFHRLEVEMGRYRMPSRVCGKVLEIGSNDGTFLKFLKGQGYEVMGVDPAVNQVRKADRDGVQTSCGMFSTELLKTDGFVREFHPDFVVARHVFCHVNDWRDFIDAVEMVCHSETVVLIEVPYVMDLLAGGEFDTIYHEHTSYLSLQSIEALLFTSGLRLHRVEHLPIHGGALLLTIVKKEYAQDQDPSVLRILAKEQCGEKEWQQFAVSAEAKIDALRQYVRNLRINGKRVAGYGASAKSTVWINACGFTRQDIDAVYDYTPEKHFRFIPGTDIPIAHEGAFYADAADYAIMFCWNFGREVVKRQEKWLAGGGKFIVPHPEIRIIGKDTPAETACAEAEVGCKCD